MNHKSLFFKYVIPSIIAFALSGIYAIVDGYFVGNTIGDAGLSAINIAYPIEALDSGSWNRNWYGRSCLLLN